ncbi:MAG: amino acid ABC transporter substrate-binding protein [candidate division NC10 bacterium]|nr:amino acid ABC transporter substrate-binding protein [candidate division NC10 bacterium]
MVPWRIVLGILLVIGFGCKQKPEEAPKGPIRIGGSLALTGRFADDGKYVHQGYLLWAKHVNAKGGLLGRPIELLIYDDKSDPQTSVYRYQQLILQDKVDLVLGPVNSPIAIVASTVTEKLRYPMIPLASSEEIWNQGYRYVFGLATPATHFFDGAWAIAKQHGLRRIALINENTVFAHSVARGVIESAREMGFQLVFHEEYRKGKKDFQWLLREIKVLKPDVLLTGSYFEETKLITRQLKQVNFMPKLYAVGFGAHQDEFGADLGKDAEYVLGWSEWEPHPGLGFPGMQEFIEDFRKEFGRLPSGLAARGYAAGQVLEAAVTKVGSLDREKIRDTLANLDMVTVYGRYKVDQDGLAIGHDVFLIQWQHGKKEIVWPERYATAKLIYPIPSWSARR